MAEIRIFIYSDNKEPVVKNSFSSFVAAIEWLEKLKAWIKATKEE